LTLCQPVCWGIEGAVHLMQYAWDIHHASEEWEFLFIDAHNASNELNLTTMLWVVQHEWPSGARFCFNTYCHWSTLVVHHHNTTGHFLYSQEGVTQGELMVFPLSHSFVSSRLSSLNFSMLGMLMTLQWLGLGPISPVIFTISNS